MNEQNGQPPGPSKETLAHLHGMLPSFAKGIAEKKAMGKGRKENPRVPRSVCPVCGTGFDFGPQVAALPKPDPCVSCKRDLDAGYTAFICDDRYIIAKSAMLADMAGKIMQLSPPVFERMAKEYEAQWKVENGHANTGTLEAGDSGPV